MRLPDFLRRSDDASIAEAERTIASTLLADLDVRTRLERERDNAATRLDTLQAERLRIAERISSETMDLRELDRIIAGMEAHLRTLDIPSVVEYDPDQMVAATAICAEEVRQ